MKIKSLCGGILFSLVGALPNGTIWLFRLLFIKQVKVDGGQVIGMNECIIEVDNCVLHVRNYVLFMGNQMLLIKIKLN